MCGIKITYKNFVSCMNVLIYCLTIMYFLFFLKSRYFRWDFRHIVQLNDSERKSFEHTVTSSDSNSDIQSGVERQRKNPYAKESNFVKKFRHFNVTKNHSVQQTKSATNCSSRLETEHLQSRKKCDPMIPISLQRENSKLASFTQESKDVGNIVIGQQSKCELDSKWDQEIRSNVIQQNSILNTNPIQSINTSSPINSTDALDLRVSKRKKSSDLIVEQTIAGAENPGAKKHLSPDILIKPLFDPFHLQPQPTVPINPFLMDFFRAQMTAPKSSSIFNASKLAPSIFGAALRFPPPHHGFLPPPPNFASIFNCLAASSHNRSIGQPPPVTSSVPVIRSAPHQFATVFKGPKDRYSCKFCGKIFPRSANLTRHLRTHTG